jgi:linoleoyl-CoA desaturase
MKAVRFNNDLDREFFATLTARVDGYFRATGKRRFANGAMWAKAGFFFFAYWVCWSTIVFGGVSATVALGLALLMGFFGTCNALNISHDASHFTFAKEKWKSSALFWLSLNQLGLYAHFWDLGHNKSHHYRTNIAHEDVAVDGGGALRFHTSAEWRPMHRFQHLYAFPLYSVYTMLWAIVRDWRVLFKGVISEAVPVRLSPLRIAELAFVKLAYFSYVLVIPMLYSPFTWRQVLVGFVAMHVVLSLYVAFTLFSSHLCEEVGFFDVSEESKIEHSFVRHQFLTTCDFYPDSRIANFFLGGFNSHVIHHLFPKISSVHYPALASILGTTAAEYKMPYVKSTLPRLFVSHLRFLKRMGEAPRARVSKSRNEKVPTRLRAGTSHKISRSKKRAS